MSRGLLIGGGLLAAGAWLLSQDTPKRTKQPKAPPPGPAPTPSVEDELGEADFPPSSTGPQRERLERLVALAEKQTGMKGLATYLKATAKAESAYVPSAMNVASDGPQALALVCRDANYNGRYRDNPWRPEACESGARYADRWAYSGGWFQMMPATALATEDKRGHAHDPARVFDPAFAVAYATDLVRRLKRKYGAKTWGDIRAGWAMPAWARPSSQAAGKRDIIEAFERRLEQVGASASFANQSFSSRNYPGFTAVLHSLMAAEGQSIA